MPKYSLEGSSKRKRPDSLCRPPLAAATKTASCDPSLLKSPVSIGKVCSSTNCGPNCAETMACNSLCGTASGEFCALSTIHTQIQVRHTAVLFMALTVSAPKAFGSSEV